MHCVTGADNAPKCRFLFYILAHSNKCIIYISFTREDQIFRAFAKKWMLLFFQRIFHYYLSWISNVQKIKLGIMANISQFKETFTTFLLLRFCKHERASWPPKLFWITEDRRSERRKNLHNQINDKKDGVDERTKIHLCFNACEIKGKEINRDRHVKIWFSKKDY